MKLHVVSLLAGLALGSAAAQAGVFDVNPSALSFSQIDLTYSNAPQALSAYSWIGVNSSLALGSDPTIGSSGFVNLQDASGNWLVQNLPLTSNPSAFDLPGMGTMFDMGNAIGQQVGAFNYRAVVSDTPLDAFPTGFSLRGTTPGRIQNNAEGATGAIRDPGSLSPRSAPPGVGNRINLQGLFPALGLTQINYQRGHPNIEQDTNQCYPASVANSLGYLNAPNTPANVGPGIRDNSLVGQLDRAMNRPAQGLTPSARDMVTGKLQVIGQNNIGLQVSHKQAPGIDWLNGNISAQGQTSFEDTSATPILDWIIAAVREGKDVEVRIGWDGGGGHAFQLVGAGYIKGRPYLMYAHDANQGGVGNMVTLNGGTGLLDGGIGFTWVDPVTLGLKCYIGGVTGDATISYAITEMVPAPGTVGLLMLAGVVASRRRRA